MSDAFEALADSVRRQILLSLADGPLPAGRIAQRFPLSRPAVSNHLRVLREAGLVTEERRGTQRWYSLAPGPLDGVQAYLDRLWTARLNRTRRYLPE